MPIFEIEILQIRTSTWRHPIILVVSNLDAGRRKWGGMNTNEKTWHWSSPTWIHFWMWIHTSIIFHWSSPRRNKQFIVFLETSSWLILHGFVQVYSYSSFAFGICGLELIENASTGSKKPRIISYLVVLWDFSGYYAISKMLVWERAGYLGFICPVGWLILPLEEDLIDCL